MSEIGTQLRTYFDETVERVTEEDVRIRATTARGVPVASPRFRPRPLAAGAIGFGLAMTLLGTVLVADRVFGTGMSDVGGGGGGTVGTTPAGGQGSPWLFIPVVIGLGLLATGIISARRRNGDMRQRGEGTMQTVETVETVEAPIDKQILTLKKRDRRLAWLAGILAVAVVGLGIWLTMELTSGSSESAATAEIEQLLDDYNAAWNSADADAYLALLTDRLHHRDGGVWGLFRSGASRQLSSQPKRRGADFRIHDDRHRPVVCHRGQPPRQVPDQLRRGFDLGPQDRRGERHPQGCVSQVIRSGIRLTDADDVT